VNVIDFTAPHSDFSDLAPHVPYARLASDRTLSIHGQPSLYGEPTHVFGLTDDRRSCHEWATTSDLINSHPCRRNTLIWFFDVREKALKLRRKFAVAPMMDWTDNRNSLLRII
jgi:hypothetical protein